MARFKLRYRTGAFIRELNMTLPGMYSRPVEVGDAKAEQIRALGNPQIMECDDKGKELVQEKKPAPKPAPKRKASSPPKPKAGKKPAPSKKR